MFSDGPIADADRRRHRQGRPLLQRRRQRRRGAGLELEGEPDPGEEGPQGHQPRLQRGRPGALRRWSPGHEPAARAPTWRRTVKLGDDGGYIDLQWDDPVDIDGATYGPSLFTPPASSPTPTRTELHLQRTRHTGRQAGRVPHRRHPVGHHRPGHLGDNPDGTNSAEVDTGASPEVLATTLKQAGTYKITISGFDDAGVTSRSAYARCWHRRRSPPTSTSCSSTSDGTFLGAVG